MFMFIGQRWDTTSAYPQRLNLGPKIYRAQHRSKHVQFCRHFATAVEAAKAFDGAVRRTIEVCKNLGDKQHYRYGMHGYIFRVMRQINFPTTEEKAFMRNHVQNWLRKPFELRLEDSEESKEDARKQNILAFAKAVRQLPPNWSLLQHNRSCVVRNICDNIARLSAIPCSTYTDEDRRSMVEQWNAGGGNLNILNDFIPQNDDEILFELGELSKDAPPASRRLRRKLVDGSAGSVRTKLVYGGTDGTKTMNELAEDAPETWKGIQALCAQLNASLPTRVQLNFYAEGLPEPSAGGPQHSYHIDPIGIDGRVVCWSLGSTATFLNGGVAYDVYHGGVVEWKYKTQCIHGIKDYDDGGFRCSIALGW